MTQNSTALFYMTEQCSLCDQAFELLSRHSALQGWTVEVIDVAQSESLIQQYGTRIPVVGISGAELDWPFTTAEVSDLAKAE